jgi:hypothetical protein
VHKDPALAEQIREGRVCVTTLATLAKVMTNDNASSLVSEAAGKTAREVEQMVARLDPKPVPADVVRPITGALPSTPVQTEVLTESLSRKHMTVDAEFDALLAAARDALSHAMPGASELEILKDGLRRIIRDAQRRKGIVDKPRKDRKRPTVIFHNRFGASCGRATKGNVSGEPPTGTSAAQPIALSCTIDKTVQRVDSARQTM